MDLRAVLLEIHAALRDASIEHALIGGLALAARGAARATVDLDLLADAERSDDVDRIVRERGYECLHRTEDVANYASALRPREGARSAPGRKSRTMSHASAAELESLLEDGISRPRRHAFRESSRATAQWDRAHAPDLEAILDWIDQIRALLGDPPVDHGPWRGGDFRL